MTKVATPHDYSQLPTTGKWVWKDETKCLEFQSNNPNADRQDKRRRATKEGNKRNERVTSSVARSHTRGRQGRGNQPKSPRPAAKQPAENAIVTLELIKSVSLDMVTEVQELDEVFDGLFQAEQFDNFLLHLLSYFHCFFEKMTQENKLKQSTYIEPSLSEKKAYADACAKLEVVQKLLGQSYCVLVLGLGLEHQHHMACGLSRVSSTYKDRTMFENLYSFCTMLVWISFRRKEYEVVKKEIGRMLRSDTFNPAIRVKNAPDEKELKEQKKDKDGQKIQTEKKLTPAEYRRLHPRRPAIKSIINQRSPAVVSILPSPKEEAHWLFRRPRTLSPKSRGKIGADAEGEDSDEEQQMLQGPVINKNLKVGILGEPRNQFNEKLTPLGAENEDEENEGEEGGQKESPAEESGAEKTPSPDRGLSRQQTAVSQVTTEAYTDDED